MKKGFEKLSQCSLCQSKKIEFSFKYDEEINGVKESFSVCKCRSCGLYLVNPRPDKSRIMKYYPNDYFAYKIDYDKKSMRSRIGILLYKKLFSNKFSIWGLLFLPIKKFMRGIVIKKNGKVLDVGTGAGGWLLVLKGLGMEGYGLDPSKEAVKVAKKAGLKVKEGTLGSVRYPNNFFDVITLHNVIEHVHDPVKDLIELRRILKPGGILIMYTPNTDSLFFKLLREDWPHLGVPQHLNLFSNKTLNRLSRKVDIYSVKKRYITEPRMILMGLGIWLRKLFGLKIKSKHESRLYHKQFSAFYLLPFCWIIDFFKKSDAIEVYFKKPL